MSGAPTAQHVGGTVLVVFVLVLTAVACGGSDTDGGTGAPDVVTRAKWAEMADQHCAELDEETPALDAARPSNVEEATEHARQVNIYARSLYEGITELPLPTADSEDAEEFLEHTERLAASSDDLRAATEQSDPDAVDAAADSLLDIGARVNELAEELDIPSCAGF